MPGLNKPVKVLIVDDSVLFRTTLQNGLNSDPGIRVVGTAVDPMDATNKIKTLKPDVLTLDVEMPKLNGIDFLKKLLPTTPIPTVVVTSLPMNAFEALQAGAVDFVKKPEIKSPGDMKAFMIDLATKVKIAANAHVGKAAGARPATASIAAATLVHAPEQAVVAIGASTGGTEAILEVVRNLPANMPGIVVVQHMPPVFTKMYAQRLDKICKMRVKEAENGDRLEKGLIIVGAGEFHLRLCKDSRGYFVKSTPGPKVSGHCPSVDVLFESVAETAGRNAVGAILTGMGGDGANGLLKMRKAGAYTIGQDKETCVVYGMPMVAFNIGGVTKQLPLDAIGGEMIRYLNGKR